MEIYNECINDLLDPGKSNLKVKDDPNVITINNIISMVLMLLYLKSSKYLLLIKQ